jgi:hypothetical protein
MMSKTNSNTVKARFLTELALLQNKTAPIEISIGATINGQVNHDFIKITDGASLVLNKVIDFKNRYGVGCSIQGGGILISFENANELKLEDFFNGIL